MTRIAAGERVLFVGSPGSGKTNLEAWLLQGLSSVVVIDSKTAPDEWTWWGPRNGFTVTGEADDISRFAKVIYQPDDRSLRDTAGWSKPGSKGWEWTKALQRVFDRGNTLVVFDETVQTLPAGHPHPIAMRIYTQGRAFNLSAWAGTQIANRIETMTARLAEHCFAARLTPKESRILCDARGVDPRPLEALDQYHFGYHRSGPGSVWVPNGPVDNLFEGASRVQTVRSQQES